MKTEALLKAESLVGKTVRLKKPKSWRCPEGRENNKTAIVRSAFEDYGGLLMERDLHGCRYWNVEDVEPA
jgi:hypothetical protein